MAPVRISWCGTAVTPDSRGSGEDLSRVPRATGTWPRLRGPARRRRAGGRAIGRAGAQTPSASPDDERGGTQADQRRAEGAMGKAPGRGGRKRSRRQEEEIAQAEPFKLAFCLHL